MEAPPTSVLSLGLLKLAMATFIEKVNALRAAFSVPSDVPLPNAIVGMSQSMGLPHKIEFHPLLEQVDSLLEKLVSACQ